MKNPHNTSLIGKVRQWYLNHFVTYITIQQSNEHYFLSRRLWMQILKDIPHGQRDNMRVWFKKYPNGNGGSEYLMIVNPDFGVEFEDTVNSGIKEQYDKDMAFEKELTGKPRSVQIIERVKRTNKGHGRKAVPFTAPVQFNLYGHIGFQGIQPTPAEIVYEYDLERQVKKRYRKELQFTDRISLAVRPVAYRPEAYGGRHAYVITPEIVQPPVPTFAQPFAERKAEMDRQRHLQRMTMGRMMRKK